MNSDRGGRELTPQHIRNNKGTGDIKSEEGKKIKGKAYESSPNT